METQVHLKEIHRVDVKIKNMNNKRLVKYLFLYMLIGSFCIGCVTKQGQVKTKNGIYEFYIKKSNSTKDPVVYGRLKEFKTNDTLNGGLVNVDHKLKYDTDKNGRFNFTVKSGSHFFTGARMGYYLLRSKKIKASLGDTIKIDYYLKPDTSNFPDPVIKTKRKTKN